MTTTGDMGETLRVNPRKLLRYEFYSLKVWQYDTLVRDYVPVKRKSDNAEGFFDKITQVFIAGKALA